MKLLEWFKTETFCIVFSLQSGTVVSIMVLTALMITSLTHIIYYISTQSTISAEVVPFCVALGYIIVMMIGLILSFTGSYIESQFWMIIGSLFVGIAALFFLIVAILSCFPAFFETTCLSKTRCPEHLWIQNSYWRSYVLNNEYQNPLSDQTMAKQFIQTSTGLSHREVRSNTATVKFDAGRELFQDDRQDKVINKKLETIEEKRQKQKRKRRKKTKKKHPGRRQGPPDGEEESSVVDESDDPEDKNYSYEECWGEREGGEEGDEQFDLKVFSIAMTCIYIISFTVYQVYCLYGFLCFANELNKETIPNF